MNEVKLPRPFAIAIDDFGWINGANEGEDGYGPFRTGMPRNMTLEDYKAVLQLAKRTGLRLQGLFILSELDRENILGSYPTTTHLRRGWNNTALKSAFQEQIMSFVQEESAWIEFGLHGVGHESWPEEGVRKRAEWYNTEDKLPWPEKQLHDHVQCFIKIMGQYGISKDNGHSFPESFVPCAYSYYWNPKSSYSLGSVLSQYGVRFANTHFHEIPECNPPIAEGGGWDHGVHVLDRDNYGNLWDEIGQLPTIPLEKQHTDYIETHWPNLLALEPKDQEAVTDKWVAYFNAIQALPDRYCAKNTAQIHSQWLYRKHLQIQSANNGTVHLDNRSMPKSGRSSDFPGNPVIKISLESSKHLSKALINGKPIPAFHESLGHALLYLPRLLAEEYVLEYEIGNQRMENSVWHTGTSNILGTEIHAEGVEITGRFYGSQELIFLTSKSVQSISCDNPNVKVTVQSPIAGGIKLLVQAHDIQGESATLSLVLKAND